MKVFLLPPEIANDTVTFRWEQTCPNPFQRRNVFSIRYDGIDGANIADSLWMEIWFALMSRIFGLYEREVTVDLPHPIPSQSVDYWLARRQLTSRVQVEPQSSAGAKTPWKTPPMPVTSPPAITICYGGGKDSSTTLALADEVYGRGKVLLLHAFMPFDAGPSNAHRTQERAERCMLEPAVRLTGASVQRVWSDYRANLRPRHRARARPHLEFFSTACLPVHLTRGVQTLTFSEPWVNYRFAANDPHPTGPLNNSRPESLVFERRHLQRIWGADVQMINPHLPFSGASCLHLLMQRYPPFMPHITTCLRTNRPEQYCFDCLKCSFIGIVTLSSGRVFPWFNYERMFRWDYWRQYLGDEPELLPRNEHGNVPFQQGPCGASQYLQFCHALHIMQLDGFTGVIGAEALSTLAKLKRLYGNRPFPGTLTVPADVADWDDHPFIADIIRIAGEHLPVEPSIPPPHVWGNEAVRYDFRQRVVPHSAHVHHVASPLTEGDRA